ncbi:MAG: CpaF family protein, partial [Massilia sp.]
MSFREKLSAVDKAPDVRADGAAGAHTAAYNKLKAVIHLKLLDKFDLTALEALPPELLRAEIASMVELLLNEEQAAINELERRSLIRDIQHEMLGFGPLELLMADHSVSDILVNRYDRIFVERRGKLEMTA